MGAGAKRLAGFCSLKKLLGLNDKEIVGEEIKQPGLILLQRCLRRLLESRNTNKGFHVKLPLHLVKVSLKKKKIRVKINLQAERIIQKQKPGFTFGIN